MPKQQNSSRPFWIGLAYAVILLIAGMRINGPSYTGPYSALAISTAPISTLALVLTSMRLVGDAVVFPAMWLSGIALWPAISVAASRPRHRALFLGTILSHYLGAGIALPVLFRFSAQWPSPELTRLQTTNGLWVFAVAYVAGQVALWVTFYQACAATKSPR